MIKILGKYAMLQMLAENSPSTTLYKIVTNTNSEKQSDDEKYKSSKSSKSTNTNKASSITKLRNSQTKMKKVFTALNNRIEDIDNEGSDLTDSDDDDEEKSHFQFEGKYWFQGVHQITGVLPNKSFMFNQNFEKGLRRFCSNRTITMISS